jgi:prephenate dehydrogenase
MSQQKRATVVGTGLIGGSIGMALRQRGWHVSGVDRDEARLARALEVGAVDATGYDLESAITFVATPVGGVAVAVREALVATRGVVTDVGSVKVPMTREVNDVRFIGGHPMAGSEQEGLDGANPTMFEGAVWVLTPGEGTDDDAFALVRTIVASFGADVVVMPPERHDALVAVVSHVPHLTAVTLMGLAAGRGEEHVALLRLAAGGFRDMTRIAAGHPGIWPDICRENRDAIVDVLDELLRSLGEVREVVAAGDRDALLRRLEEARAARLSLPQSAPRPDDLAEVRVPIPDRKGEIASVASLATDLDVNIYDLEIAHSTEGSRGVLILLVDVALAERLRGGLLARGYRPSIRPLR